MKVLAICGPYRGKSDIEVYRNIELARVAAEMIWELGICAICLHKNTEFMSGLVDEEVFLEGARELVRRSDGVFMLSDWRSSEGAIEELKIANRLGLEIFNGNDISVWDDLKAWATE